VTLLHCQPSELTPQPSCAAQYQQVHDVQWTRLQHQASRASTRSVSATISWAWTTARTQRSPYGDDHVGTKGCPPGPNSAVRTVPLTAASHMSSSSVGEGVLVGGRLPGRWSDRDGPWLAGLGLW